MWRDILDWTWAVAKHWLFVSASGATASHAAVGDDVRHILTPLVLAALVVASWVLRPEGRRLKR